MKIKGLLLASLLSFALWASMVGLIPGAQAFTLGPCKWRTGAIGAQFLLYYYNGATGIARSSIEMAVQAWYDVPIPLWLVPVTSEASANIIFKHLFGGGGSPAAENNAVDRCTGSGLINSPVTITLYVSFQTSSGCCTLLSSLPEDQVIGIAAHEIGHALGLAHNDNRQSLMFGQPFGSAAVPYNDHRIFVPVYDDIRGVADLYGWCCPFKSDTTFTATAVSGSSSVSGTTPPLTLRVSTPESGSYAQAYNTASLPDPLCSSSCSKIAVMMAIVTPLTLYRFHMGWEIGSGLAQPFVTMELDNDGAKLVMPLGGLT